MLADPIVADLHQKGGSNSLVGQHACDVRFYQAGLQVVWVISMTSSSAGVASEAFSRLHAVLSVDVYWTFSRYSLADIFASTVR